MLPVEFMLYSYISENVSVNVVVKDETIWLTQKSMAELFGCSTDNISLHLKNIFNNGELDKQSVTEKISSTAIDGKNYLMQFYNLDAIISVGYRVNSTKATKFRIWDLLERGQVPFLAFPYADFKNSPFFKS